MALEFETIDGVQAEYLLKPISKETELSAILRIMRNQLFRFYMSQLKTGRRNLLYPGAGADATSMGDIRSEFQKNYFVDKLYSPEDTVEREITGGLDKLVDKNNLTLIYQDLRDGLPRHIKLYGSNNGLKIYIPSPKGESVFQKHSIDLLIIKGLLLESFTKFREQLHNVLHPNALIAICYHCLSMYKESDEIVWGERYELASELSNLYCVTESVVPYDFSLPDEIAKQLQQKMNRPVRYLNQVSPWYFFRKAEML